MISQRVPFRCVFALGFVYLLSPYPAAGQGGAESNDQAIEIITVTARRVEESILDTPMSLSVLTEADFIKRQAVDVLDIGKIVPNLTVNNFGNGNLSHAGIYIRGIGTQDHWITTDPGVGLYVDGVYLGRQMGANLGLLNIERVEVARGPQGTLYGRNSMGGAVNLVTRKPNDDPLGKFLIKGGSLGRASVDGYFSMPLNDAWAVSLGGAYNQRDGVGEFRRAADVVAEVGEMEQLSFRGAVSFDPSESISFLLTADYANDEFGQVPYVIELLTDDPNRTFGVTEDTLEPDPDDSASLATEIQKAEFETVGFSLTGDFALSDSTKLKAILSHRELDYTAGLDLDSTVTFTFPESGDTEQTSFEIQVNSDFESWSFVGGFFYFNEDGFVISDFDFGFPNNRPLDTNQETTSYAVYASGSFDLSERWTLGAGLRYTQDEKEADASLGLFFDPPGAPTRVFGSEDWDAVTWDLSLRYTLNDSVNGYALISRGYQNGGFPARAGFNPPEAFVPFDPQYSTNFEIGMKGQPNESLLFSASVFFTVYDDLQLVFNQAIQNGFLTITQNAGESESFGVEVDGTVLLGERVRITGSVGYLDSEITEVDDGVIATQEGFAPIFSPEWTVSLAPTLAIPMQNGGNIEATLNYSYRSEMYGQSFNSEQNLIDSRSLVDLYVAYNSPNGNWSIAAYGKNIGDEVYQSAIVDNADAQGPTFNQVLLSNDREEYGVQYTMSFGNW